MTRASLVTTGIVIVSLLMAPLAFAALPRALPPEQTQGGVTYVSGGIGQDETQAFEAAAAQYPLDLEFAIKHAPRAEYTANVHVIVTDAQGTRVLDTHSDGPFLLVSGCVNMLENWPFENVGCALGSRRCENAALQDE